MTAHKNDISALINISASQIYGRPTAKGGKKPRRPRCATHSSQSTCPASTGREADMFLKDTDP